MVRIHTNHCHVCRKKVGLPRVVPADFRPQEVLCFACPDDSFKRRPHPAVPRTAPAVREPLPAPRLDNQDPEDPRSQHWQDHMNPPEPDEPSLAELMRPVFGDEWSEFGREMAGRLFARSRRKK